MNRIGEYRQAVGPDTACDLDDREGQVQGEREPQVASAVVRMIVAH